MIRKDGELPPQKTLHRLFPLHSLLYESFEQGVEHARSYFATPNFRRDPFLFASLVRYHAGRLLADSITGTEGFRFIPLPNSGIKLMFEEFLIRVWKADEGQLPPPGTSVAKTDFYYQPVMPDLFGGTVFPVRLAVIWDLDASHALKDLILVCPKGSGDPWEPGHAHWQIEIPHPADSIRVQKHLEETPEDLEDLKLAEVLKIRKTQDE